MDSRPEPAPSSTPPADERQLITRCRAGDTRAFGVLVDRYRDRAYGLAWRLLRSEPDAEEVAQDAFVRAWKGIADFRGDAAFGTWLYRIVWRRSLDRAAILNQRRARETPLEPPATAGAPAEQRADLLAANTDAEPDADLDRRWERLTAELTPPQRAVVTLFYYGDHSLKEVARALEMPEGTVKTHLSRARAVLRRHYEALENDDRGV